MASRKRSAEPEPDHSVPPVPAPGEGAACSRLHVGEALQCIVCLDFPASPIHNCVNGHITCGLCIDNLTGKPCSYCKAPAALTVSFLGERLAKQLELKMECPNEKDGCKELVKSTELKRHAEQCPYRPVICRLAPCNGKGVRLSQYFTHLRRNHDIKKHGRRTSWYITVFPARNVNSAKLPMFLYHQKRLFLLRWFISEDAVYLWAEYPGSKTEAAKFHLSVQVLSSKEENRKGRMYYRIPALPIHSGFGPGNPSPFFAQFPLEPLITGFGEEVDRNNGAKAVMCRFHLKIQ